MFLLIFCLSLLKYTYYYNYRSHISLQVAKLAKSAGVQILIFPTVYTAGKISIEHVTIFLSKNISKGAIDMKFSPDVGNNPSNQYTQRKQIKYVQKLSYV